MHAIILAAGRGSRLKPLTATLPKPLIKVAGKPLLEHVISALPDKVTSIDIVIGYLGEMIKTRFGNLVGNRDVTYIEQIKLNGTGGAIALAKKHIDGPTLVVNADDIYSAKDLERLSKYPLAILATQTDRGIPSPLKVDKLKRWQGFAEPAPVGEVGWQNCGAYVIDKRYFDVPAVTIPVRDSQEISLPHTFAGLTSQATISVIPATYWLPVGTHEELTRANIDFTPTTV